MNLLLNLPRSLPMFHFHEMFFCKKESVAKLDVRLEVIVTIVRNRWVISPIFGMKTTYLCRGEIIH